MSASHPTAGWRGPWNLLVAKAALVAGVSLLLLWWTLAFTASMVLVRGQPEVALRTWPTGVAQATVAANLVARPASRAMVSRAMLLGRAALGRSPVDAMAVRAIALALVQQRRLARGRAVIAYAEALSRRDEPTQLWLIEDRVQAGDVVGALTHYNRAMLTLPDIRPVLMPVLAQAADEPAIARPLVRLLNPRPEWWSDFLGRFLEVSRSPAAVLSVGEALRLDPRSDIDRYRVGTIVQKLIDLNAYPQASGYYLKVMGDRGARGAMLIDGGFETADGVAPLDWQLVDATDHAGIVEPRRGASGQAALTLSGAEGQEVARQLLGLRPGSYRLTARTGAVSAGLNAPPSLAVECSGTEAVLASGNFTVGEHGKLVIDYTVPPAGCGTQWLRLNAASHVPNSDEDPWVDDIAVQRTSAVE